MRTATTAAAAKSFTALKPFGAIGSVARLALLLALVGSACTAQAEPLVLPLSQTLVQEAGQDAALEAARAAPTARDAQATPAAKEEAERAAAQARDRTRMEQMHAEQALIQAREAQESQREVATAARRAQELASRRTTVVRIVGDVAEIARAVSMTTNGTVQCTPMGSSLVLTGEPEQVGQAEKLIHQLSAAAEAEHAASRDEERRRRAEDAAQATQMTPADQRIFDVTLGPTLGESLAAISAALGSHAGGGLNIVFVPDETIGATAVRPVELKRVTLRASLNTLIALLPRNPDSSDAVRIDAEGTRVPGERPVVTVSMRPMRGAARGPLTYETAVFRLQSLRPSMEEELRDEILADQASMMEAIEVGLGITGRSKDFKIKLHPETGLMFVHGAPGEIDLVAEVLGEPAPSSRIGAPAAAPTAAPAAAPDSTPAGEPGAAPPASREGPAKGQAR